MGIRFHCNYCDKRLNVKARQAGEFCFCPDCDNEIKIPLESTIVPIKKKRERRRRVEKQLEVDVSPSVAPITEANSIELESRPDETPTIVSAPSSVASVVSALVDPPTELANESLESSVDQKSVDQIETVSVEGLLSDEKPVPPDPASSALDETIVEEAGLSDSTPDGSFGDAVELDSEAALDQMLSSDESDDGTSSESESFLLAKPVAKIGDDPLKANPDLVWYLRHKRLGEKGPLKARQVEEMLEDGAIRIGYIVWREDWNDWVPAEEVFPSLAKPASGGPAYEIPADLNPHSEASRKRRSQKRFWMCFNAAAFLLVVVLVYWLTQFGSS